MPGKWALFDNEFQRTRERVKFANSEFDKESRLADVQEKNPKDITRFSHNSARYRQEVMLPRMGLFAPMLRHLETRDL